MYDIVTIGGAVEDITFYTREGVVLDNHHDVLRKRLLAFEYGAKIKIKAAHTTFGGGAANVAVSARRLGLKTAAICALGKDERGRKIITNLKEHGVDTRLVQRVRGEMSGFSFLLVGPENEHIVFSHRAANSKLAVSETMLQELDTTWLYITSLSGNWRQTLKTLFAHAGRFRIAWNPGGLQLSETAVIRRYLKYVHAIILNEDEACELVAFDREVMARHAESAPFLNNVKNLLTAIKGYGSELVMITRGRKGADCYDGKQFYHADIQRETKRVDTTGVGDAFGSAFVCGLMLYDNDIERAMELGIKNSASVIAKQGAQNGLLKL